MWQPTPPAFAEYKKKIFADAAKVADFIYQIGESPLLRSPSKPVPLDTLSSEETKQKIAYLKKCLLSYHELTGRGRAIAGVQVGIPEQILVVFQDQVLLTIINPTITATSEKLFKYPEICMSANPIVVPLIRPAWIEFTYVDEQGARATWNKRDDTESARMLNRVFQHEIDHLQGIVNVDRVSSPDELILESDPGFYDNVSFQEIS